MYEIGSRPPPRRRGRLWLIGLPVFAVFAAFGSIVWVAYVDSAPGSAVGEPPLIKADASPIKLSPDDPGGRVVADQGEVRRLLSDEATPQLERLLPPPEQPLAPVGETAAVGETRAEPGAEAADQARSIGEQGTEPTGAPAAGREAVAAATTAGATPAPQAGPQQAPASDPPSDGAGVGAAPGSSPAAQDAEAALEALLAEVTGDWNAASDESQDRTGAQAEGSPGSVTAQGQRTSLGSSDDAGGASRSENATASPGNGAGASDAGGQTAAPGEGSSARLPVEAMPSQSRLASSEASYRIQLAAVRSEADARRAWDLFRLDLGDVLADLDPVIERAETSNGVFYRVQVGEFASLDNAEALCDRLKQRNASCFVIRR